MTTTISTHPSTSGLRISLHPLALLTVSDYITRHTLRQRKGPIIGALLGTQNGREIAVENAYELRILPESESADVTIDKAWFETKLQLFKETHPTQDLLGWFSTTSSAALEPSHHHTAVHQSLLDYNESLILLLLNPAPAASVGGKLPVAVYESVYEAEDGGAGLALKFVPLPYGVETGEAEMIAMDMVARGASNASEAPAPASSKGKGVEAGDDGNGASADGLSPENADLIASLSAKKNAIVMLNSRIQLLLSYLKDAPEGGVKQSVLREIKALTHSRLGLVKPEGDEWEREKRGEEADVNLVVLLGALTKSIEAVKGVGKKWEGIEGEGRRQRSGLGGMGGMGDRMMGGGVEFGRGRRAMGGLGGVARMGDRFARFGA